MDHLSKQQVILIALLVAIVTSITTGIVIFSLSDQSGGGVSQVIYRVVEKTIANVTAPDSPVRNIIPTQTATPTKEPAQIPLSDIAASAGKKLLRIYTVEQGSGTKTFITLGVSLGSKGLIVGSDLGVSTVIAEGSKLVAVTAGGDEIPVILKRQSFFQGMPLFILADGKDQSKIPVPVLGNFTSLKLGANVIAFGGKDTDNVISTGIIAELDVSAEDTSTTTPDVAVTDMVLSSRRAGLELFDTSGNLVGLNFSFEDGKSVKFINVSEVKKASENAS